MHEPLYRELYRIRRVEEEIVRVYPSDKIKSPVHLSIGQEAIAVGTCAALRPEDVVFCSYRCHAAYLAKGGDLRAMIAELYGKATGCARGKGGSMHLVDTQRGVMGSSAVVGTPIANAVGYALALERLHPGRIVACFFGDGATEEGVFYEALSFAALKRLPILFVCENNRYAIHTHQRLRQPRLNIRERAAVFGIPAVEIEDDVLAIRDALSVAADALRRGEPGPFFFECFTYRWKEHVGPNEDWSLGYRSAEEAAPWIARDPVRRLAALVGEPERQALEAEVEREIAQAFAFAEQSPFPAPEELLTDVYR